MRNKAITLLLIAGLCSASGMTAQSVRTDLIDLKKSQHELEIMRGILGTTISFFMREMAGREPGSDRKNLDMLRSSWRTSDVSAFYLHGQGAVFIIPASGLRSLSAIDTVGRKFALAGDLGELEIEEVALEAELAALEAETHAMEAMAAAREHAALADSGGVSEVPAPPAPPSPPQAPAAPAPPPKPSPRKQDEVRKRLEKMQEKVKQRQADAEARRAKLLEQLDQLKVHLVEALANHGDSLTHVKPNEYLNIIITAGETLQLGDPLVGRGSHREVLSVQKSAITDYKAGRISLDAFKQKVLSY